MDTATLVSSDVELSLQVIESLDLAHLRAKVAIWILTPEYEEGRLVLAGPDFDRLEPLKAYEAIVRTLSRKFTYSAPTILLLRMKDPFIKALRHSFSGASKVRGMRVGGQMIGNRFVDDGYVYRID